MRGEVHQKKIDNPPMRRHSFRRTTLPLLYALQRNEVSPTGSVTFARNGDRAGSVISWNNASGHYIPDPRYAHQAGLPLDLFKAYDDY